MVPVSGTAVDGTVTGRIADNGPGIPAAQAAALFGRTRDLPDTGLGLTVVDRFGGHIRDEDDDPRGRLIVIESHRADGERPDGE